MAGDLGIMSVDVHLDSLACSSSADAITTHVFHNSLGLDGLSLSVDTRVNHLVVSLHACCIAANVILVAEILNVSAFEAGTKLVRHCTRSAE